MLIAEVDVRLHRRLLSWGVVAVKTVHNVLVERRSEDGKISVPLSTAEDENVVVIDLIQKKALTCESQRGG